MSDEEQLLTQAKKRRERVLKQSSFRMEAVGGSDLGSPVPDAMESEVVYDERIFSVRKARVEAAWFISLVFGSAYYGVYYDRVLRLDQSGLYIHPILLFALGEFIKYLFIVMKMPQTDNSYGMALSMFSEAFKLNPVMKKLINNAPALWNHYKVIGDIAGDICLALLVIRFFMLVANYL
ncbi:putative transmembrane protein [Gregarina niphandrodes]|uniref:Transmembrane protein n=1 Tax=Gregarina niphandrodes TaxID=110365 RepID=A0A023B1Q9_GRENI|nr:putative transmembrane protein [Gregarina niphandrodes]EZG47386.1 putative transmembrane protein [Gregarina niphandrodes]|eukprot:XP_011132181.1 putative transmembrane protein [Gregarina niphandrodes]